MLLRQLATAARTRTHHTMTKGAATTPFNRLPVSKANLQRALTQLELNDAPSHQRRSKSFPASTRGVWARVNPLWTEWPLRVTLEEARALGVNPEAGEGVDVEDVLRRWDPVDAAGDASGDFKLTSSAHRLKLEPTLLGVSEDARQATLPDLDVGDAADPTAPPNAEASPARAALVDVLSGRKILSGTVDGKEYGPWSTRYCGHQFGEWAGQLGDGRAVSVIESDAGAGRHEVQLKGAGRTPFARSADGLAVLRSGVREYLGCEAVSALGIPTTRALAILTAPVVVLRENGREEASLVARVAPTFIRIGHFEALNPGEAGRNARQIFFGGGWNTSVEDAGDTEGPLGGKGNLEGLRDLVAWIKDDVMQEQSASARDWFFDVVGRNAHTVALWQVYGFMHGVLNTDNISITGLTIDYGPYAFMDVFDPNHICNHSDPTGLYSYKNQPNRVLFALDSLATALLPVLGYEAENSKLPAAGWSDNATADDVRRWEQAGLEAIKDWNKHFTQAEEAAEREGWGKRFGIQTMGESDDRSVVHDYLVMLKANSVDFGASLRLLSAYEPSRVDEEGYVRNFAKRFVSQTTDLPSDSVMRAEEDVGSYLRSYAARASTDAEKDAWTKAAKNGETWEAARTAAMRQANPRFVLRQWVLEEVIKTMDAALKDADVATARRALALVLDLSTHPFEAYGEAIDGSIRDDLSDADAERARLCGQGPKSMLGFQCSCSS